MKKPNTFLALQGFLVLWAGQMVSSLGSSMTSYALILWVYEQQGTATSVSLLSFFTYLPSVLLCFITGALADQWDKKRIMLVSDSFAALGTVCVLWLYGAGSLRIWHLYLCNFAISCMNAFQSPASYVAVSLLTPKDQYQRIGGLYAFSGSVVSMLAPALATFVLLVGGLRWVLAFDLLTFAVAFTSLLYLRIPKLPPEVGALSESLLKSCLTGLRFLREHGALLRLILFFSFINLLAYMTGFGILPAMILTRTNGNEAALGMVSSAMGIGTLAGSILATLMRPPKDRVRVIFLACGISFLLCDIVWGLGRNAWLWVPFTFLGNVPLPFLNANLSAIMRTNVPIALHGRVFSARDTLQYATIPLGLLLGGLLADHVFEPFMARGSALQSLLTPIFGAGKGSGMAVLFLLTGITGALSSFWCLRDARFRALNDE